VHAYYFDIPFDETLARHASKPNAHEFGEKEMREWWKEKDHLGLPGEKTLHQGMSVNDIVDAMMRDIGMAGSEAPSR
jgi:hypothetical protein